MKNKDALLVTGDAFNFLAKLDASSLDLIISSPPYFMGKEYDSSLDYSDFLDAHKRLAPLLIRVLKPGGSVCWQVGHHVRNGVCIPLDAAVYATFSEHSEFILRNRIVWTFGHGTHSRRRFSGRHETILWYTKGDDYYFDLDPVRVPQKYPGKRYYRGPRKGQWSGNPKGKNPTDVWDIPNVKANHPEKTAHPCQFPVALAQRLVLALAPPDGIVADPFMGSGSTAVASVLEGRQFLGCDREVRYVEIARNRLADVKSGKVKIRPHDRPLHSPSGTEAVSQPPPHFWHSD